MKILFEKFDKYNKPISAWTILFNNLEELLEFIQSHKVGLLGEDYIVQIREIKEYK